MTPERLNRVREIYEAAIELEHTAREELLDHACEDDEELRAEVERLLGARERLPEWFLAPILGPVEKGADRVASGMPVMEGRQLGRHKLIRKIGSGGMGVVYLAERADGAFRKQVAIKIAEGKDNAAILERFQREREILASLDHPNIARLIDGGSTEEGLPYFVMEFVEGQRIDTWCDERKLNITQRLELFRSVCAAVQYAHQHLVVHLDLKPGNIFVTNDGVVKLLDFGIAKILKSQTAIDATVTLTLRIMTPAYASPEQLTGGPTTTLTDVYSLGVVLYELLTGHRPYHLVHAAMRQIAQVVAEEEPPRPSDIVVTPGASEEGSPQEMTARKETVTAEAIAKIREGDANSLRKRLQGDVDCIVLTALRKEPSRRYSSVEALSDDLRLHLEDRPVHARNDTFWYRATRFVRRHSIAVAAGVLIAVSLAAGITTELWQIRTALGAGQQRLSGRTILAPQLVSWLCLTAAMFGGFLLFLRPGLLRIAGALAGSMAFAATWFFKLRLDYQMGWWRSRFADAPDPLSLFSWPLMFGIVSFAGAVALLISWRLTRRFGLAGQAACILAMGLNAIRDRVWWDKFMHIMTVTPGVEPLLSDIALLGGGFALAQAVMRIVSGPSRKRS